ncbi:helix-turn-helix domain-containing protein [Deinococcus apachensis]|uniref:helix-turn-helix domain-containing protein n=1 Tax=Deinococcus apachensis TaxID=309886 RepID=UPI00035F3E6F|nr:helix-turn-helix domain-containing protein [Deinococcus apachensis]
MSSAATGWAWQQHVPNGIKTTLLALADLADGRGRVQEPQEEIATRAGCKDRTVRRHLAWLEEHGLIRRERTYRDDGGRDVDEVQLMMKPARKADLEPVEAPGQADQTPPGQSVHPPLDNMSDLRDKHPYSLLGSKSSTNNNSESSHQRDMHTLAEAGLMEVWRDWAGLVKAAPVTLKAQAGQWAAWVREGRADALRAEAQSVIELGSYAHPFAGLKARIKALQNVGAQAPEKGSAPPRPALVAGQRVRYPDGSEATVVAVLSRGVATDHPDYPDVPLGQVKTLTVLTEVSE